MKLNDTIVAQSTPQGKGAIGIIRLSGKDSIKIVNSLFPSKDLSKVKSHTIHYGNIQYEKSIIDEVLISVFKKPNSYTRENIIEISCHGSDFIIKKIISITVKLGARVADKGEFTFRSFLSGNIDLSLNCAEREKKIIIYCERGIIIYDQYGIHSVKIYFFSKIVNPITPIS